MTSKGNCDICGDFTNELVAVSDETESGESDWMCPRCRQSDFELIELSESAAAELIGREREYEIWGEP